MTTASSAGPAALDLDLVRKYAVAGPRYTSYPPATRFTADFAHLRLEDALIADQQTGGPLSLYVHVPFCESLCWYCGCHTVITRDHQRAEGYLADLALELDQLVARLGRRGPRRTVTQLHLGGGTPTFLTPPQLRTLGELLRSRLEFSPTAEISVEIDPRRLTEEHVSALRELGARRASLGVQDTQPEVQLAIHRLQPHTLNEQAFAWLRAAGFTSINVDLIYGLPLQTPASIERTITEVLALGPDRLSVFNYAHVPWLKPAQKIFEQRGQLPDTESKLAMFATAHRLLVAAGLVDIGLDHFARPDDELARAQAAGTLQRNFQGYSTQAGTSLYGLGISAISATAEVYFQNVKSLPEYRARLAAGHWPVERGLRLSAEDQRRRTIIMSIMCERKLDFARLSRAFGEDFATAYAPELATLDDLYADGVIAPTTEGFAVTALGTPLLRIVAMRFDAASYAKPGRHSQAI